MSMGNNHIRNGKTKDANSICPLKRNKRQMNMIKRIRNIVILSIAIIGISIYPIQLSDAQTSGPTAPEYTSFEPVDVTDMVNLSTGDFTYTIPLIEVPGPEGGYPLALSYHAGIKPLEDASWVGLGWSLNPGAINRIVNGYADDWKNAENTVVDRWNGGETHIYSLSYGYKIGGQSGGVGVNYSFGVSNDTYRGFGGSLGMSIDFLKHSFTFQNNQIHLQGRYEISQDLPYGQVSAGITTDYNGNTNASIGYSSSAISVGATISSNDIKGNVAVVGIPINQENNKGDYVSERTFNFSFPIGATGLSLGYNYRRYWIDEHENLYAYGVLNPQSSYLKELNGNEEAYDIYVIPEPLDTNPSNWQMSGSLPAYDSYSLATQGLTGNIQPLILDNMSLVGQNIKGDFDEQEEEFNYYEVDYKMVNPSTKKIGFRIYNDFSNRIQIESNEFNWSNPTWTIPSQEVSSPSEGWNAGNQKLAGSHNIEWFTNAEILVGTSQQNGFVDTKTPVERTLYRGDNVSDQIGGFMVTKPDGMTYHFALPVYNYDQYNYSKRSGANVDGIWERWNKEKKAYAYTWILTAITGPDYVDMGSEGLDNADYGYWVEFEHGKWTDSYKWRNPSQGYFYGIDGSTQTYSAGIKQLYYLDAIYTRSHVALFIKDVRNDGKGVSDDELGGFEIENFEITSECVDQLDPNDVCESSEFVKHYRPTSAMKLNKILLIDKADFESIFVDLNNLRSSSDAFMDSTLTYAEENYHCGDPNVDICTTVVPSLIVFHIGNNVIDIHDLSNFQNSLVGVKKKEVDFEHDYSLSPETSNSFEYGNVYHQTNPTKGEKSGKLTLNSIKTIINGAQHPVAPPQRFYYEDDIQKTGSINLVQANLNGFDRKFKCSISNTSVEVGDLIKWSNNGNDYYCSITSVNGNDYYINIIGENIPISSELGINFSFETTKNPPYHHALYDEWGYYKSDYRYNIPEYKMSRKASPASAKGKDAWSIRSIQNTIGSKTQIKYSSDRYDKTALQSRHVQGISSLAPSTTQDEFKATFWGLEHLSDRFEIGQQYEAGMIIQSSEDIWNSALGEDETHCDFEDFFGEISITSVVDNELWFSFVDVATGSELYQLITNLGSNEFYVLLDGYVYSNDAYGLNGGDVRVDEILMTDQNGIEHRTVYNYVEKDGVLSSGLTSYLPVRSIWKSGITPDGCDFGILSNSMVENYLEAKNNDISYIMKLANEIPAPGVKYGRVLVEEYKNQDMLTKTEYVFDQFDKSMVEWTKYDEQWENNPNYSATQLAQNKIHLKNRTVRVGNLISQTTFNDSGQMLRRKENKYLHDNSNSSFERDLKWIYNGQGLLEQNFNELKIINTDDFNAGNGERFYRGVVTKKTIYPNIITESKVEESGVVTVSTSSGFDFYTGTTLSTTTESSYGEKLHSVAVPAYHKYEDMGLKVGTGNEDKHHMLTQNTASYIFGGGSHEETPDIQVQSIPDEGSNAVFVKLNDNNMSEFPLNLGGGYGWLGFTYSGTDYAGRPYWMNKERTELKLTVKDVTGLPTNLSSVIAGTTWLHDLLDASVTTWNDSWDYRELSGGSYSSVTDNTNKIWRKHQTWNWKGELEENGALKNYIPFDWEIEPTNNGWQKTSEITLYDHYSKPLEAKDINENYASSKMGYDQTRVISTVPAAKYIEMGYSGAEDPVDGTSFFGGEIEGYNSATHNLNPIYVHTGKYSIELTSGNSNGFEYEGDVGSNYNDAFNTNGKYQASVWVKIYPNNGDPKAGDFELYAEIDLGSSTTTQTSHLLSGTTVKAGEWYLATVVVDLSSAELNGAQSLKFGTRRPASATATNVFVDDFRFHPVASPMTSYVYDQNTDQLTHILDAHNFYTRYEYDHSSGRLKAIYQETIEGEKKVSEFEMNYGLE